MKYVKRSSCLTNEKPLTKITMNNELKVNKEMWKSYKMKSCIYVELMRTVSNFKNGYTDCDDTHANNCDTYPHDD
ncbi:hypothetical protein SNEBB_002978 [Seison nebaliae]|nr:hypothetical protein SNEBB_002978 [Seison nebaliae]